ncbi:methyltransferase domain-containing protein [Paenibacillus arenilitoris]|nr:class I SAM-dependent methyltransferase [Paenibacillus arenilitoris]
MTLKLKPKKTLIKKKRHKSNLKLRKLNRKKTLRAKKRGMLKKRLYVKKKKRLKREESKTTVNPTMESALEVVEGLRKDIVKMDARIRGLLLGSHDNPFNGRVFLVEHGIRRWIPGPEIFEAYGFRWPNIRWVDKQMLNCFTIGPNLSFPPSFEIKDRKSKILNNIDLKNSVGLEIGPLSLPIVSKDEGNIYYADHTTTEELIKKYQDDPGVDVTNIPQIDFIWGEKTYRKAIPSYLSFDYIVASHVIEHIPDVIGWLAELSEVLKDGGFVCLAIPDKRYTFDYFRKLTTTAELIDAYLNRLRRPGPRQIFDNCSNVVKINTGDSWSPDFDASNAERYHSDESAMNLCIESIQNKKYVDVHCSVYTSHSFLELFNHLSRLHLVNFKIAKYYEPERLSNEFIVILQKLPK